MKKNKIEVIMGTAKVKPAKTVEVTSADGTVSTIGANHIIIATGARARALPNIPIDGEKVIGYRQAMVLPTQPKSMVVIGSGAIGVEFAYVYAAMGTKVTIVEFMPNLVPVEDEDISKGLGKQYKKMGIDFHLNSSVESVDTKGAGCKVAVKTPEGNITIDCDVVLSAAGVIANIENIQDEMMGIMIAHTTLMFGLIGIYFALPVIGAVACAFGKDFRYPLMGGRLARYLGYDFSQTGAEQIWLDEDHEDHWVTAM